MGKSTTSMTCWSLPSPAKACDSDRPANTPIQNYIIPSCENGSSPVRSPATPPPTKRKQKPLIYAGSFLPTPFNDRGSETDFPRRP